jgi:hypothetical protein
MKIIVLAIHMMIFTASIFADQSNKWEGIYTFNEESWDENRTRSSRWFRLEVSKKDGKLIANYSDGENGTTWQQFSLNVVVTKDKAIFRVDQELSAIGVPCSEGRFLKGDLLFELRETKKDGKRIIQTIWGNENLGSQSESGGLQKDGIFFRKV